VIRVLVADDQALLLDALAAALDLQPDVTVVATVTRGDEVVPAALRTRPDVALLDVQMPGGDGLTVAARLRVEVPGCRVVMLTTFARAGYLRRATEAGAVDDGLQVRVGEAGVDAGDRSEGRRAQVGVDPCGPYDGGVVALDDEAAGAGVRPRTHRGPLG